MVDWLTGHGWTVDRVAWGKTRGIDIEAHRENERWIIEAKAEGSTDQKGGNYFLGMLGELLQRMSDESARYAIALPETRRYRGLVDRFPDLARRRIGLDVFWVRDGMARLDQPEGKLVITDNGERAASIDHAVASLKLPHGSRDRRCDRGGARRR